MVRCGLLHGLIWPLAVGTIGQVFVEVVVQGGAVPVVPALFPLASAVAVAIGHVRLGRLTSNAPEDQRLKRMARLVLGGPMALIAFGCLAVLAVLLGFPLAQQVPDLATALMTFGSLSTVFDFIALVLAAPLFLLPFERRPDGSIGAASFQELRRRWSSTRGARDAATEAAEASGSAGVTSQAVRSSRPARREREG